MTMFQISFQQQQYIHIAHAIYILIIFMATIVKEIYNSILAKASQSKFIYYAWMLYQGSIAVGSVYGAWKGFLAWVKWMGTRKLIKITNKTLQPIVNTAVDAGRLAFQVLLTTFLSAFVVSTAPLSVPFIIITMKQKQGPSGQ